MFSFCLYKQRICRCLKWADILLQPRFLLFQFLNVVKHGLPLFVWLFCFRFFLWFFKVQGVFLSLLATRSNSTGYINLVNATHILHMITDNSLGNKKSQPADELLQLSCLLKSLFLQLLDHVKEQATFCQRSTTCCTCLCQPWSHASGYPLCTWLGQNSKNGLIPCQSWKMHTQSAGIITSLMNILIFQVSSLIFHDLSRLFHT